MFFVVALLLKFIMQLRFPRNVIIDSCQFCDYLRFLQFIYKAYEIFKSGAPLLMLIVWIKQPPFSLALIELLICSIN